MIDSVQFGRRSMIMLGVVVQTRSFSNCLRFASVFLLVWISLACLGTCDGEREREPDVFVRGRLRKAASDKDEEPNQATCWPHGSYGLLKADSGCPAGDWDEGWSIISTSSNKLVLPQGQSTTHLYGWVTEEDRDIAMYFCIKSLSSEPDRQSDCNIRNSSSSWPNGTYCILKASDNCPEGFYSNKYDALFWNRIDNKGGCTPPVTTSFYKVLHYWRPGKYFYVPYASESYALCCRSDGDLTKPVSLPNQHSFVLLANTNESSNVDKRPCQEIMGMQVRPEIIKSKYIATPAYNYYGRSIKFNEDFIVCYYSPLGPNISENLTLTTIQPGNIIEHPEVPQNLSLASIVPVVSGVIGNTPPIQPTTQHTLTVQDTTGSTSTVMDGVLSTVTTFHASTTVDFQTTAQETTSSIPISIAALSGNKKQAFVGGTVAGILLVVVLLVMILFLTLGLIYSIRRNHRIRKHTKDPLRIAEFSVHAPLLSETDVEGNVSLSFHSDDSLYSEVYNQQERIAHVVDHKQGDLLPPYAETRVTLSQQTTARNVGVHYEIASMSDTPPESHPLGCGCSMHLYSSLSYSYVSNGNEEIYTEPPSDMKNLQHAFNTGRYQMLQTSDICLNELIGCGNFGDVYKGTWRRGSGEMVDVAVKKCKVSELEQNGMKFLQEAAIMGQFDHPNIARLYGIVRDENTEGESSLSIVIELLMNGDLREYLCAVKNMLPVPEEKELPKMLLRFAREIATGMSYLSKKKFVHRDLAARNILLDANYVCKISDFGMTRDLQDTEIYVSHGGQIPLKWTAPEAVNRKEYTTASDVWSYGCLLYEIWSLGDKPLNSLCIEEICRAVLRGPYRQPPPPGCPRSFYQLMMDCWNPEPAHRPTFQCVCHILRQPPGSLLHWSDQDLSIHKDSATLGADPSIGELLYKDLQNSYM